MRYYKNLGIFLLSMLLNGCCLIGDMLLGPKAKTNYSSKKYSVENSFGRHTHSPQTRYKLSHKDANGQASHYGGKFNGRKTSSCVIFDDTQMTAAHPTAVIPSIAKITRVDNNKSVYVIITDRGPFAKGRICDLSTAAAQKLGYINQGHIKVHINILPDQSKVLAGYWRKFLHKKLPNDLFKHIHNTSSLSNYLKHM